MDIFSTKLNDFINKSNLFQATHSIKWSKQTAGGQISPCFEVSVNQFMVIYKKPKRTKKSEHQFLQHHDNPLKAIFVSHFCKPG